MSFFCREPFLFDFQCNNLLTNRLTKMQLYNRANPKCLQIQFTFPQFFVNLQKCGKGVPKIFHPFTNLQQCENSTNPVLVFLPLRIMQRRGKKMMTMSMMMMTMGKEDDDDDDDKGGQYDDDDDNVDGARG